MSSHDAGEGLYDPAIFFICEQRISWKTVRLAGGLKHLGRCRHQLSLKKARMSCPRGRGSPNITRHRPWWHVSYVSRAGVDSCCPSSPRQDKTIPNITIYSNMAYSAYGRGCVSAHSISGCRTADSYTLFTQGDSTPPRIRPTTRSGSEAAPWTVGSGRR